MFPRKSTADARKPFMLFLDVVHVEIGLKSVLKCFMGFSLVVIVFGVQYLYLLAYLSRCCEIFRIMAVE